MIEIAAAVCLMTAPHKCRDISLTFEADTISMFACMMYGQGELAKWSNDHPGWRVARYTCRQAGQIAKL